MGFDSCKRLMTSSVDIKDHCPSCVSIVTNQRVTMSYPSKLLPFESFWVDLGIASAAKILAFQVLLLPTRCGTVDLHVYQKSQSWNQQHIQKKGCVCVWACLVFRSRNLGVKEVWTKHATFTAQALISFRVLFMWGSFVRFFFSQRMDMVMILVEDTAPASVVIIMIADKVDKPQT